MAWLGLDYDEGPIFQMQRLDRYREVVARMLDEGSAYRCYCTPAELEAMREAQRAQGVKTHYDGRWRPEPGKVLPAPPTRCRAGDPVPQSAGWRRDLGRPGQGADQYLEP